eukprot:603212-Pyramimonas_sp.AAC.1
MGWSGVSPLTSARRPKLCPRRLVLEQAAQEHALKARRPQFGRWGARTAAVAAQATRDPAPAP